ncbi:MAG: HAD family phosphatase [Candidatus Omnitrophota bacterium]
MVKGFIFDLGNVLINFDHNIAVSRIAPLIKNMDSEYIYNLFFDSDLTRSFEEGKIMPFEFYMEVKKRLNCEISYDEFVKIWNEIFYFSEENALILSLAQELNKKFPILVLSNINKLHYDYLKEKYYFIFDFTYKILSFEMNMVKPHPSIYKRALAFLGTKPDETIYIDDRKDLIEAAGKLGLYAVQFKNTKDIFDRINILGIDVRSPFVN